MNILSKSQKKGPAEKIFLIFKKGQGSPPPTLAARLGNYILGKLLAYNFIKMKSSENRLPGFFKNSQKLSILKNTRPPPQTPRLHTPAPFQLLTPYNWNILKLTQNFDSFK